MGYFRQKNFGGDNLERVMNRCNNITFLVLSFWRAHEEIMSFLNTNLVVSQIIARLLHLEVVFRQEYLGVDFAMGLTLDVHQGFFWLLGTKLHSKKNLAKKCQKICQKLQ